MNLSKHKKLVSLGTLFAVVIGLSGWGMTAHATANTHPSAPSLTRASLVAPFTWKSYRNARLGFVAEYPDFLTVSRSSSDAVTLEFPLIDYAGTSLYGASIESSYAVKSSADCLKEYADLSASRDDKIFAQELILNGVKTYKTRTVEGALGTLYDVTSYTIPHNGGCYTSKLVMRYDNVSGLPSANPYLLELVFEKMTDRFRFL